jgi:ABC-type amino acid transport substrate-binding protein
MPNSTVVLPHTGNSFQHFADLKGKTIGGLRGAVYDPQFAADEDIRKYDVDSYRMGLQMAKSGRIDGSSGRISACTIR